MENKNHFILPEREPLLIVISGPSGVGKDTVIDKMKQRNADFHFVVTATTRPPRQNEVDGRDYIFVSMDCFAEMIERHELLEYALVYGDYKGIPKSQVQQAVESNKDVVMRVDVQGAKTVREKSNAAVLIFLTTENEAELEARLRRRKSDDAERLNLRVAMAREELKRIDEFDYLVVNRDNELDKAVDAILAIVEAEHHRAVPKPVEIE